MLKRPGIALLDAIADQELTAAKQMPAALSSMAPGTAKLIGAQAGAWLVRSNGYTQQAMAERIRLRPIELAGQSAKAKEGVRFTRETKGHRSRAVRICKRSFELAKADEAECVWTTAESFPRKL